MSCDQCEETQSESQLIKARCADFRHQTIGLKEENQRLSKTIANQRAEIARINALVEKAEKESVKLVLENKNLHLAMGILKEKCKAYEQYINKCTNGQVLCIVQNPNDAKSLLKLQEEKNKPRAEGVCETEATVAAEKEK